MDSPKGVHSHAYKAQSKSLIIVFFLATITILMIAVAIEVFFFRRNRVVRDISSMVGEHLNVLRNTEAVGGPMPIPMLSEAMNQVIDETDEKAANESIKLMLGLVMESKRRSFALPLVHRDVAIRVKNWADRGEGETAVNAAKLFTSIAKRHTEHMEQVIAQSYVLISKTDARSAIQAMKSLAHQIDGAVSSGMSIDSRAVLMKENNETVREWLSSNDDGAKAAAEMLLKTVGEADSV
jgi:hypothetical protein